MDMSPAERELKHLGIWIDSLTYDYRKKGAEAAAKALGIELGSVIKTLVISLDDGRHVIGLAPGDRDLSLRAVCRAADAQSATLASERSCQRLTGYQVGGISPFGTRTKLPTYIDRHVMEYSKVYINGGRRGLLLAIDTDDLVRTTAGILVAGTG